MLKLYKNGHKITSPFGMRILNGKTDNHKGIDVIGLNTDRKILSPISGKVVSSTIVTNTTNKTWEWGNYIRIDDAEGYRHFFCHMSERCVRAGENINAGEIIGIQGQTGLSFGEHLHYEIRTQNNISIDPEEFWKEKTETKELTTQEAIQVLVDKGIINTPDYWLKACDIVKNLSTLIIKIATYIKG